MAYLFVTHKSLPELSSVKTMDSCLDLSTLLRGASSFSFIINVLHRQYNQNSQQRVTNCGEYPIDNQLV